MADKPPVLETRNLEAYYGAVMALRGVSIEVPKARSLPFSVRTVPGRPRF